MNPAKQSKRAQNALAILKKNLTDDELRELVSLIDDYLHGMFLEELEANI